MNDIITKKTIWHCCWYLDSGQKILRKFDGQKEVESSLVNVKQRQRLPLEIVRAAIVERKL